MARQAPTSERPSTRRHRGLVLVLGGVVAAGLLLAACGGDSEPVLSSEASQGRQVARDKGCTACHTETGARSEGPTWKGLAGSTVTLSDGTTVVADDAYLARSIREPKAQVVQGYRSAMPTTPVTDEELQSIITYLKALA